MTIQYIGYNAATGNTTTLPTGCIAYDVAIVFAIADGEPSGVTPITVPTGWTTGPVAWFVGSGTDPQVQCAWRVLGMGESGDSIGEWIGADMVWVAVYRGLNPTAPLGNNAKQEGPGSWIRGITALAIGDETSWVVACLLSSNTGMGATHRDRDLTANGLTNRGSGGPPTELWTGLWDTNTGVAAFGTDVAVPGGAGNSASLTIELLASTEPIPETPYTWELIAGSLPTGLSLDSETGDISGTPTAVDGVYIFTIVAYNNYFSTPPFTCQITVYGTGLPAATWSVDLEKAVSGLGLAWHRHSRTVTRPAIIQDSDLYYADESNVVQKIDPTTLEVPAYWISPMLNREKRHNDYTLTQVLVRYQAADTTSINIYGSGDGGRTWKNPIVDFVPIVGVPDQYRWVRASFNVTGSDVRFKVECDQDVLVRLFEWQAKLIEREGIRRG